MVDETMLQKLLLFTFPLFAGIVVPLPKSDCLSAPICEYPAMTAGYNAPEGYAIRQDWGVVFSGSFIYWQPSEEGLELGQSRLIDSYGNTTGRVLGFSSEFAPGFKGKLGGRTGFDNWDFHAEYTWLYTTHGHASSLQPGAIYFYTPWFYGEYNTEVVLTGDAKAVWKLHTNIVDLVLGRSFFVGRCLVFHPFLGARGDWFFQRYFLEALIDISYNYNAMTRQRSWGMGPRAGLETNFHMGPFHAFGVIGASLLYSTFDLSYATQNLLSALTYAFKDKESYITPDAEISLGMGWGNYFSDHGWHFDLAASYEFQIFWNQNGMRHLVDVINAGSSSNNGNLFFQGLNVTMQFDF